MNNFFGADLLVSDSGFSNSNTMEIAPSAGKKTLFFLNFQFDWSQIPQGTGAIATVRRGSLLGHSMSMADGVDVSDNGAANVIAFNASQVDFLTTISPGLMPDIIKIVAVPEPSEWILAFLLTAFTTQIGLERRRARKPT